MVKTIAVAGLGVLALKYMRDSMIFPRGIRNNNPGNLRGSDSFEWLGEIGRDPQGFVIFDKPHNGLRALGRTLLTYRNLHGVDTPREIINRWAPPSENETEPYIEHVAGALNVSQYLPLPLEKYPELIAVIIRHENGMQPYSAESIQQAFERARV